MHVSWRSMIIWVSVWWHWLMSQQPSITDSSHMLWAHPPPHPPLSLQHWPWHTRFSFTWALLISQFLLYLETWNRLSQVKNMTLFKLVAATSDLWKSLIAWELMGSCNLWLPRCSRWYLYPIPCGKSFDLPPTPPPTTHQHPSQNFRDLPCGGLVWIFSRTTASHYKINFHWPAPGCRSGW